jgi:hypothetical protein
VTWCGDVVMSVGGEAALEGERKETMPIELTQILLSQKMKKIHDNDSAASNG